MEYEMKILSRNIKIKKDDLFGEIMVLQHFFVSSKKYVFQFHFVYALNELLTIRAFSEYHGKAYRRIGVCDGEIDRQSAKKAIADDKQWRFDYGDVSRINDMKKCLDMLVEYMLDKDYINFIVNGV